MTGREPPVVSASPGVAAGRCARASSGATGMLRGHPKPPAKGIRARSPRAPLRLEGYLPLSPAFRSGALDCRRSVPTACEYLTFATSPLQTHLYKGVLYISVVHLEELTALVVDLRHEGSDTAEVEVKRATTALN